MWWDPKARDSVRHPQSLVHCLLLSEGPAVLLASKQEMIWESVTAQVALRTPKRAELPVCDLETVGRTFRLWFCMPHRKSEPLRQSIIEQIDGVAGHRAPGGHIDAIRHSDGRLFSWTQPQLGQKRLERFTEIVTASS